MQSCKLQQLCPAAFCSSSSFQQLSAAPAASSSFLQLPAGFYQGSQICVHVHWNTLGRRPGAVAFGPARRSAAIAIFPLQPRRITIRRISLFFVAGRKAAVQIAVRDDLGDEDQDRRLCCWASARALMTNLHSACAAKRRPEKHTHCSGSSTHHF